VAPGYAVSNMYIVQYSSLRAVGKIRRTKGIEFLYVTTITP
jgi:hypothetical protein